MEADRPVAQRHDAPPCRACGKETLKTYNTFGISGHYNSITLYQHESEQWALATGGNPKTMQEIETWAHANGKEIVEKGYVPKKPDDLLCSDREMEKALDKHYAEHHAEDNPDGTPKEIEIE